MLLKIRRYAIAEPGDSLLTRIRKGAAARRIPPFPRTVQVETVAACNADCVWCPYGKIHPKPPAGRMTEAAYGKIVEECARHGVLRFSPYLTNEPLLDRAIEDRIRTAREAMPRAKIVLTTNGALLDAERTDRILDLDGALHALYISLHGVAREGYEATVGRGIPFAGVLANVNHLLETMRKRRLKRPKVWITMVATRLVDAPRALAYWKARGVRAKYTALENRAGQAPGAERLAVGRMSYYDDCPRMFKQAYIAFDGALLACCTDYARRQVLGNVLEAGIEPVWRGAVAEDLRRRFLTGRIHTLPLCGDCRIDREREVAG